MDRAAELGQALEAALRALGLPVEPHVLAGLEAYDALLVRWQRRVRLVGRTEPRHVAVVHLADALTILPFLAHLPAGARVLDVGTGAGLPGIPLALARPDLAFALVEPDLRKAAFVKAAVAALGLKGVRVYGRKALGQPEAEGIQPVDLAVSRAFRAPDAWLALARAYLRPGGWVVAMMAAQAPPDDAGLAALGAPLGLAPVQAWRGHLPDDGGPRVVVAFTPT